MAKSKLDKNGHERVECLICKSEGKSGWFHQLAVHLSSVHEVKVDQYRANFPGALTISAYSSEQASKGQLTKGKELDSIAPAVAEPNTDAEKSLTIGCAELFIRDDVKEAEMPLVPAHDDKFHIDVKVMEELALGIQMMENILIAGETGCGKTTTVEELGSIANQPVKTQNLRGDIRSSAFIGQQKIVVDPESGQSIVTFVEGILPQAMKNGWWLLLDELDAAPPAILFVLQRVLTHRQLCLDDDHGRVVEAHPNFRIIATANTLGRGDDSGLYTGTNILNEAFLDRFGTVILQDYLGTGKHGSELPDDDAELGVVANKSGLNRETIKKMITVARLVRKGKRDEECYCTFSTRRLLSWAKKTVAMGGDWDRSSRLTFINKLGEDDRKYVEQIMQRVMGSSKGRR